MVYAGTASVTAGTTATVTWTAWNQTYIIPSSSMTATATSTNTWIIWNETATTAATTATDVWPSWQARAAMAGRRVDPAEAQRRLREQAAAQERYLAAEGERAKARERAQKLLHESLDEAQRAQLADRGFFELQTISKDGERRRYRINRGTHGNVKRLDESGKIIESLCVQPNNVPTEDAMLAQKLWLETNEEQLRRVANITRY